MIIGINEIGQKDRPAVGNKAANLASLAAAGFIVPEGFCLTTEAYRQALARRYKELDASLKDIDSSRPEKVRDIAISISRLFDTIAIPDEIIGEIKNKYRSVFSDNDLVAVRSSATAEDLPGLSFAGQYDSYLNIGGFEEILSAIRKCWASLWSERAIIYRQKNGISHRNIGMAVIIQRMIPAELSGVIFTADPVTNDKNALLIDLIRGGGEDLVSGKKDPDQYRLSKSSLKIEKTRRGGEQLLWDVKIRELAGIAKNIEKLLGAPQDIEWALSEDKFYILQSRDITTGAKEIPFPVIWGDAATKQVFGAGPIYWSNWNTRENMPYPLKPLSWSFFNDLLVPAINRAVWGMGENSPAQPYSHIIDLVNGRTYWNMSLMYSHPLYCRVLRPIMSYIDHEASVFFENIHRHGELRPVQLPLNAGQRLAMYLNAVKAYLRFHWFWGIGKIYRKCDEYWALADEYDSIPMEGRSNLDLLKEAKDFGYVSAQYAFPLLFVAGKSLAAYEVIRRLIKEWPGFRYEDLMIGIQGNKTTESALELFKLSRMPGPVRKIFESTDVSRFEEFESELAKTHQGREYLSRIEKFLGAYGHRGMKDLDMGYPSWSEDRSYVYLMIKNYLQFGPGETDPLEQFQLAVAKRRQLVDEARKRLSQNLFDRIFPLRRWIFQKMADIIHDCLPLRENEKFYGVRCFPGSRRIVLEIGRRYRERGLLADGQDIFFLTIGEITDIENGKLAEIGPLIQKRKDDWQRQVNTVPPFIICSDGRQWFGEKAIEGEIIKGVPASSGRTSGKARIIREPAQAHRFRKGEILVAPYTEPGWAPLFLLAKGLVMEVGGALCHGAIVAREYGIPAVVGAAGATALIKDGDEITVDGNSGEVFLNIKK